MSFVVAQPDWIAAAATDLAGIGSSVGEANAAALAPTTRVLSAAADEVSAAVAAVFGSYGQAYQALGAQAAAFNQQFLQALSAGAAGYAGTEAASVSPPQAASCSVMAATAVPACWAKTEAPAGAPT
ncbi:hypothetical protein A5641_08045 [Mycobacterium sp. 1554424.7]|nr:hypothetical protein A5641_08045 [Mycobacterium sp. 1554424.7]